MNETIEHWHSRGYLPHLDSPERLQSITFRLADSLPQKVLADLEEELKYLPDDQREAKRRAVVEHWLDLGRGCCALRNPQMADIMQGALLLFDGSRYRLLCWSIMPNHVHALIKPEYPLPKIVQSWKSYTGRWALTNNDKLNLGIPKANKSFWMREYWDRYIRDQKHLERTTEYIRMNPVKAGLCNQPTDWRWSSAGFRGK